MLKVRWGIFAGMAIDSLSLTNRNKEAGIGFTAYVFCLVHTAAIGLGWTVLSSRSRLARGGAASASIVRGARGAFGFIQL